MAFEMRLTVPAEHALSAPVRHASMAMLEMFHPTSQELSDAILVTSELFANAVDASLGAEIDVHITVPEREVKISITNIGAEFELPIVVAEPSTSDPRGRGLRIAQMLGHVICCGLCLHSFLCCNFGHASTPRSSG